jgi:hypothetical protein
MQQTALKARYEGEGEPSPTSERWYPLKYHAVQAKMWRSKARFNVVPAGRRSGKTEIMGKRKPVLKALKGGRWPDTRIFCGAPTRDQARRIFWSDLKLMVPKPLLSRPPSESHLSLYLINGSEIHVLGMDKPERIEGPPWDHGVLDEFGNMKPQTWREHVRPALSDRHGSCDFIGVPEGRNHYYDLDKLAKADDTGSWASWHWKSADILDPLEIEQAQRDLDELTYQQEYEGSFISFSGMAYYNFREERNCQKGWAKKYNKTKPLILAFDFNESPGVCAIIQEMQKFIPTQVPIIGRTTTAIIGEVHIPQNSNTIRVCDRLVKDWGSHQGHVYCYGDATGGAGGSAKVSGSDWDLVRQVLYPTFRHRLHFNVDAANPRERARVNAMNSRLFNMLGETYLVVDPTAAPNVVKDFEGVRVIQGGTGEIDKKRDPGLTHLTDGVGYYINKEYPIRRYIASGQKYWK